MGRSRRSTPSAGKPRTWGRAAACQSRREVMSEDASANAGAVEWPHPDSAYFTVRRMQAKLHRWAGEDPSRRFGDLFSLVCDPAFLVHAWERVSTSRGAQTAGIDKATAAMIETWVGIGAFLGQIRDLLKSGEFRPAEVRQVMIPKGSTGKFRKLGIPTIADRVVQASLGNPYEHGLKSASKMGGILSPLMANIALSVLGTPYQRKKRRRRGQGNYQLIRYADDFVLMVSGDRHHAEALREEVTAVLAPVGLRLAPEKTRVVHIDEGFDFLGFHIRRMRKRGTRKHYVCTRPSRKAVQAIKDKVTARTYRSTRD